MALMTLAVGFTKVSETVFENRFMHAAELGRMGAQIAVSGSAAVVAGVEQLSGAPIMASDLRAGAALLIAALAAGGRTDDLPRVSHRPRLRGRRAQARARRRARRAREMTFAEALAALEARSEARIELGLGRVRARPVSPWAIRTERVPALHVAGTERKGSTCAMLGRHASRVRDARPACTFPLISSTCASEFP